MAKKPRQSTDKTTLPRAAVLPNAWLISKQASLILWQNKKLFLGISVVYGLLSLVLAQGLSSGSNIGNDYKGIGSVLNVFLLFVGSAGTTTSQSSGAYQLFVGIIASLAIIWSLREVFAGRTPRIRDGFYKGMYPLVPFILVLVVIGLQLIPLLLGTGLYSMALLNGIAVSVIEKLAWGLVFIGLAGASLYMISASIFALYIVCLSDMTPIRALRSAKDLVKNTRLSVLRKLLFLPIILTVIAGAIMVPVIIVITPIAQYVFFVLTTLTLVAVHAYIYTVYRELLNE